MIARQIGSFLAAIIRPSVRDPPRSAQDFADAAEDIQQSFPELLTAEQIESLATSLEHALGSATAQGVVNRLSGVKKKVLTNAQRRRANGQFDFGDDGSRQSKKSLKNANKKLDAIFQDLKKDVSLEIGKADGSIHHKIKAVTGLDTLNKSILLTSQGVRHSRKNHPEISTRDWGKLMTILKNGTLRKSKRSSERGETILVASFREGSGFLSARFIVGTSSLTLKIYKRVKDPNSDE